MPLTEPPNSRLAAQDTSPSSLGPTLIPLVFSQQINSVGEIDRSSEALAPGNSTPHSQETREYTIDELAREAGNTVRNVRAYQERGLLPQAQRRGRSSVYTESHLARLRVIGRMLERGYSLSNVSELLNAWEQGQNIGELLGLEAALTMPWAADAPVELEIEELLGMFKEALSEELAMFLVEIGIVEIVSVSRVRVPNLKLVKVASMLTNEGVPLDQLVSIFHSLRKAIATDSERLIQLVVEHVFDKYGRDRLPPQDQAPRLAEMMWQLRPLALQALNLEMAMALEKNVERFVGERLTQILANLAPPAPSPESD